MNKARATDGQEVCERDAAPYQMIGVKRSSMSEEKRMTEAGETDQGGVSKLGREVAHCLGDIGNVVCGQIRDSRDVLKRADRIGHYRTDPGHDVKVNADCLQWQDDVGEEDGGVDAIASYGLQGDLSDQVCIHAGVQHVHTLARLQIFGKRAPRLPHVPDRSVGHRHSSGRSDQHREFTGIGGLLCRDHGLIFAGQAASPGPW